ncbi:hypothetical protein [Sphingopyxis sp.]|uniref:hypothetical protein n=1 Tax=Sphingopyxis sp. TaxID=1908224 RepID=UPI003F6F48D4
MTGNNRGDGTEVLVGQKANHRHADQPPANGNKQGSEQKGAVSLPLKQPPASSEAAVADQQAQTEQPSPYVLRDLTAQEDMAFWAMWMFVAAVATFVITSLGTLLIWRQVTQTRQAVEDTGKATAAMLRQNELTEETQRPWIIFSSKLDGVTWSRKAGSEEWQLQANFKFLFENEGKTPVRVKLAYRMCEWGEDIASLREEFAKIGNDLDPEEVNPLIVFPGRYLERTGAAQETGISVHSLGEHREELLIVGAFYGGNSANIQEYHVIIPPVPFEQREGVVFEPDLGHLPPIAPLVRRWD